MDAKIQQHIIDDIKRNGWHLIIVPDDDEGPGFVYSVGMMQTLKHPEIIIFGLESDLMVEIIHGMGEEITRGRRFDKTDVAEDLLKSYPCKLIRVAPHWQSEYMGYALWHHRQTRQPGLLHAIQVLWPDKRGRFPDNPACHRDVASIQPVLAKSPSTPKPNRHR